MTKEQINYLRDRVTSEYMEIWLKNKYRKGFYIGMSVGVVFGIVIGLLL